MLTPPLLYADLAAFRAAGGFAFSGYPFDQLAWAMAYAVSAWLKAGGVSLKGVCVGTAGAGVINVPTTRLVVVPQTALVIAGLQSAEMSGPLSVSLGTVVSQAMARSVVTSGQYAGGVVGVGVGADVSKVVTASGSLLGAQLMAYMPALLGSGPATARLALGLGTGIAAQFLTITGTGTVIGSPSIVPAMGQSTAMVV